MATLKWVTTPLDSSKSRQESCKEVNLDHFIIFLNDVLLELECMDFSAKIGNLCISFLSFADDIILTAESAAKLRALIEKCGTWSMKNGIELNIPILMANATTI